MQGLTQLLAETDLVDLHHLRHPHTPCPPTYNHGTQTIDTCLGSPEFASSLVAATILPFGIPALLTGDHRTLLLDFNSHILFGNAPPPAKFIYLRGVHSNSIPTVTKFSKWVGSVCNEAQISERIANIEKLLALAPTDHADLDAIDNDLTRILVRADLQCRKFNESPWSPTLSQAYYEHWYWSLKLSKQHTKQSYQQAYELISHKLEQTATQLKPNKTVSSRQRKVRTTLHNIRREAQTKQKQFLDDLLWAATAAKDKHRRHLILGLKHAEDN